MTRTLVTGAAGFIGFHLCRRYLDRGDEVLGIDNLNDYYEVQLKRDRLQQLAGERQFNFVPGNIADRALIAEQFARFRPQYVIHMAAQAGVRYSLQNPYSYADSNLVGFLNILEGCRQHQVEHLVYASSSSVYGANTTVPYRVEHNVDHPVSLYAATKKANELMAHSYSHLYRLPTTGLRFFTVYGPWGRPDMALYRFTQAILAQQPIDVYGHGHLHRDFTYIDDVVEGVVRVSERIAQADSQWSGDCPSPASSAAPYRVYNIGNNRPVRLDQFIATLEQCLGMTAIKNLLPEQPGDVPYTCADVSALMRDVGYRPDTPIEVGIARFVQWYLEYTKD